MKAKAVPKADDSGRGVCNSGAPAGREGSIRATDRAAVPFLIVLGALGVLLIMLVGWEVIQRRSFPQVSIGFSHLILTLQACLVTSATGAGVYVFMRRQQRTMATTAEQLARVLAKVRRMRARMVEKEKMAALGQITAGVAHEIGNPLSSISSIVQMLQRDKSNAPQPKQLDLIETHIQRILVIVRQMEALARPGDEQWESIDIGQTLEEAVQLISADPRAKGVKIDYERPKSLPNTYALRGPLQQVFINLSLNALDAMPDGGRLTISASQNRQDIVVRAEDTGGGIAPEISRRVFEPFFTTKEPGRGTGMGLAVGYGIVEKHGGTIRFESIAGRGTRALVQLPILDKAPDV